ncbi:unnamed protein product [Adineta ricciae]|uniref:Uncharacterized protein n=1 Tax=Adineta ricciae TaxID=249248 RepID=A0A813PZN4_ADIRI|nr:unnamed protein product [Adineta ricciae]
MSGFPPPSAVNGVWPRMAGATPGTSTMSGAVPIGGGSTTLPTVNNPNLPTIRTPFPSLPPTSVPGNQAANQYTQANNLISANSLALNAAQNQAQVAQNEAYRQRLNQLEDENEERRHANINLTQMGAQVLQGQMDIQEQVLEYQYMLEHCMDYLDHQNQVISEQSEELSLIRAKMKHFEYLMDALKLSKEGNNMLRTMSGESNCIDQNLLCCRDPIALPPPSTSPFFAGGPTRVTGSTFQPFNPRYRSPNSRAAAAANLSGRQSTTPSVTNTNRSAAVNRLARRPGTLN